MKYWNWIPITSPDDLDRLGGQRYPLPAPSYVHYVPARPLAPTSTGKAPADGGLDHALDSILKFLEQDTLVRVLALGILIGAIAYGSKHFSHGLKMLKNIKAEVNPNHGSSLKDAVNRIEAATEKNTQALAHSQDLIKHLAVQVQEVKSDARATHEQISRRLENLEKRE